MNIQVPGQYLKNNLINQEACWFFFCSLLGMYQQNLGNTENLSVCLTGKKKKKESKSVTEYKQDTISIINKLPAS